MSKTVSNDALWEKLSEMNEQFKAEINIGKDEIIREINEKSSLLGKHNDLNFGVVNQNLKLMNENITKGFNIIIQIRKQQKEIVEPQKADNPYFNFKFFKVRKSSFVIAILGLLVLLLMVFCMKQQNDYTLLLNEYCKQNIL